MLGALALLISDSTSDSVAAVVGHSDTAAAALSAMDQFLDRPTLDRLRRVLGLTPSGAVRLVDRLAEAGLVTRQAGPDGRSRAVTLTVQGRQAARHVQRARADVLEQALASLTVDERRVLHGLAGRVLAGLVRAKVDSGRSGSGGWTCRMCDLRACGRDAGTCPAAHAAADATADRV